MTKSGPSELPNIASSQENLGGGVMTDILSGFAILTTFSRLHFRESTEAWQVSDALGF
jgi:hypothetical protein